jgi:hypothetical protein
VNPLGVGKEKFMVSYQGQRKGRVVAVVMVVVVIIDASSSSIVAVVFLLFLFVLPLWFIMQIEVV